ncbi:hypothetical protein KSX_87470 [Ktedonospora formicarum]|uniref:Uncharacterized protein n=1 Tax=Ktedonospora formicarum TaxID=2778364 RepID=A0A8J3IEN3_9CHLR|nr:hypothetical protein KSX_75430 [Ktedonospora formicarum]GHO49852.1 hypothetical protein KSX_80150 [Ktedonospora formicarum]GHO50584.1 hypothetical protein KSX_87470 [Ktedonospora formicarum]
MSRIWEGPQVPSDLGKERFQHALTDPSDRIESFHRLLLRGKALFDFPIQPCDTALKVLDHHEEFPQQEAVMGSHAALQGRNQGIPFVGRSSQRQIC